MNETITMSEQYDIFMEILLDQNKWKNIYQIFDAQNLIYPYIDIPYINGKNKGKFIVEAIAKNDEISPTIKEEIITYMINTRGMIYNKYEILFENIAKIGGTEAYDRLAELIIKKQVTPNYQAKIGNIFHIIAYNGISQDQEIEKKFKMLIDCGCDILSLNRKGMMAIDVAIRRNNKIVALAIQRIFFDKKTSDEKVVNITFIGNGFGRENHNSMITAESIKLMMTIIFGIWILTKCKN